MLDPSDEPPAPNPERFVEMQSVFIPLLNKKVSAQTWIALQNRSIHQLTWSVRTKNILLTQDFKTLAEIAELPPKQWLKFRNFGRKSLTEIQEIVNKIIANPNVLDPKSDHSVEVSQIQTLTELGRVVFNACKFANRRLLNTTTVMAEHLKIYSKLAKYWELPVNASGRLRRQPTRKSIRARTTI